MAFAETSLAASSVMRARGLELQIFEPKPVPFEPMHGGGISTKSWERSPVIKASCGSAVYQMPH